MFLQLLHIHQSQLMNIFFISCLYSWACKILP